MEDKYIGMKFGRYTILERRGSYKNGEKLYLCKCECGTIKIVALSHLKRGKIKSCGCYGEEVRRKSHKKHGMYNSRIYKIWLHMKERCFNKNCSSYNCYGRRGITVCEEWLDFTAFCKWAFCNGYSDNLTIDRIDNDKGYCPNNCRWVTRSENSKRASQRLIEIDGVIKNISEWCACSGASTTTMGRRMQNGGMDSVKEYIREKLKSACGKDMGYKGKYNVLEYKDLVARVNCLEIENEHLREIIKHGGLQQ